MFSQGLKVFMPGVLALWDPRWPIFWRRIPYPCLRCDRQTRAAKPRGRQRSGLRRARRKLLPAANLGIRSTEAGLWVCGPEPNYTDVVLLPVGVRNLAPMVSSFGTKAITTVSRRAVPNVPYRYIPWALQRFLHPYCG